MQGCSRSSGSQGATHVGRAGGVWGYLMGTTSSPSKCKVPELPDKLQDSHGI